MASDGPGRVTAGRVALFCAIALGGAAFDLATKSAIFAAIGPQQGASKVLVPDVLELRLSHNAGALWGLGRAVPQASLIFAALSLAAAVAICWWLFVKGAARDARYTVALALIMAGAMGNCYDRLRYGYVRDFVYFHVDAINFSCAIFNFADNMLVLGAVGLMLLALRPESEAAPEPKPAAAPGALD